MSNSKYSITKNTKIVEGETVYQIRAKRTINNPFGTVKKGELGGWVRWASCFVVIDESWVFPNCVYLAPYHVPENLNTKLMSVIGSRNNRIVGTWREVLYDERVGMSPMIRVGCQYHSLEDWKKNYKSIGERNYFSARRLLEYLGHLATIEKLTMKKVEKPFEELMKEYCAELVRISGLFSKKPSKEIQLKLLLELRNKTDKMIEMFPKKDVEAIKRLFEISKKPSRDASGRFAKKS
jgi:hypothetical protein